MARLSSNSRTDTAVNSLILADITSLQWRGFVNGAINLPYVVNAFVGAEITAGINGYSTNGWRWGVSRAVLIFPPFPHRS
jgi:hypothetical protein